MTASFGVSTWQGPNDAADALLRRADEALYAAKRSGRNCAVAWKPPATETPVGLQRLRGRDRLSPGGRFVAPVEAAG